MIWSRMNHPGSFQIDRRARIALELTRPAAIYDYFIIHFPLRSTEATTMAIADDAARHFARYQGPFGSIGRLKERGFHRPLARRMDGLAGKVADTFNSVVEQNQMLVNELDRLTRVVGKEGKIAERAFARRSARLLGRRHCLGQRSGQRPGAPDPRNGPRHRRRGQGRPLANHVARQSTSGRWKASSCGPPRPSTRWSISSARSPRK